jgi:8-oxo-dGTP pyrophosphatase MutT (NUDIX family)
MITATSINGDIVKVPKSKFRTRVSGYAVVIHEGKILLVNTKSSGKLFFPGGEINLCEKMSDGIKRELWEETGIKIEIGDLITHKETFFYYEPYDEGYHNQALFFKCKPLTFNLSENHTEFDEAEKPAWHKITDLKKSDFHSFAYEVFKKINLK